MHETWPPTKLGECCDILDSLRVPLNAEQRGDIQGDVPYYGANGLQGYIDKFIFDEPLILLAEDGGYFDEYESRPIAYKINGKSWVNNHAHILRAKSGGPFSQDFIFYCLQHKNITPFIKGGTRAKLNQAELREILIPKAPALTQRRIAEILSTLDEAIEQTESLIAKHQQIKAGLMHDLFTRGVTPDGHLRPTREQAPDLYKPSPLGWIPKEWEGGPLAKFLIGGPKNGYSPPEVSEWSGLFSLGLGCLTPNGFRPRQIKIVSGVSDASRSAIANDSDLFLSRSNTRELVGLCGIYRDIGGPCIYPDLMMRIKPNEKTTAAYLEALLLTPKMRHQITAAAVGTSGSMVKLNSKSVLRLEISMPKPDEQMQILKIIRVLHGQLESFEAGLSKLHQQKHGLMHDLLTGRVRVVAAEATERASDV